MKDLLLVKINNNTLKLLTFLDEIIEYINDSGHVLSIIKVTQQKLEPGNSFGEICKTFGVTTFPTLIVNFKERPRRIEKEENIVKFYSDEIERLVNSIQQPQAKPTIHAEMSEEDGHHFIENYIQNEAINGNIANEHGLNDEEGDKFDIGAEMHKREMARMKENSTFSLMRKSTKSLSQQKISESAPQPSSSGARQPKTNFTDDDLQESMHELMANY